METYANSSNAGFLWFADGSYLKDENYGAGYAMTTPSEVPWEHLYFSHYVSPYTSLYIIQGQKHQHLYWESVCPPWGSSWPHTIMETRCPYLQ